MLGHVHNGGYVIMCMFVQHCANPFIQFRFIIASQAKILAQQTIASMGVYASK